MPARRARTQVGRARTVRALSALTQVFTCVCPLCGHTGCQLEQPPFAAEVEVSAGGFVAGADLGGDQVDATAAILKHEIDRLLFERRNEGRYEDKPLLDLPQDLLLRNVPLRLGRGA